MYFCFKIVDNIFMCGFYIYFYLCDLNIGVYSYLYIDIFKRGDYNFDIFFITNEFGNYYVR